jgi:hypothetical protein
MLENLFFALLDIGSTFTIFLLVITISILNQNPIIFITLSDRFPIIFPQLKNCLIWDNTIKDGEAAPIVEAIAEGKEAKPIIDRTTFDGGKKFYSGLLIKQIK